MTSLDRHAEESGFSSAEMGCGRLEDFTQGRSEEVPNQGVRTEMEAWD